MAFLHHPQPAAGLCYGHEQSLNSVHSASRQRLPSSSTCDYLLSLSVTAQPPPHPLHVPNPMSGTGEGQEWRRKDCTAPLVQQDRQRLGSIAAVLCIKGTSSVGKPKNHAAVMKTNVAEYIHPQHPPRAGADQAFAHARLVSVQGACTQGDEWKCHM